MERGTDFVVCRSLLFSVFFSVFVLFTRRSFLKSSFNVKAFQRNCSIHLCIIVVDIALRVNGNNSIHAKRCAIFTRREQRNRKRRKTKYVNIETRKQTKSLNTVWTFQCSPRSRSAIFQLQNSFFFIARASRQHAQRTSAPIESNKANTTADTMNEKAHETHHLGNNRKSRHSDRSARWFFLRTALNALRSAHSRSTSIWRMRVRTKCTTAPWYVCHVPVQTNTIAHIIGCPRKICIAIRECSWPIWSDLIDRRFVFCFA